MIDSIIAAIDKEIATLQQARSILAAVGETATTQVASRRGRPKGSKNATKTAAVPAKRVMSKEGRARIAAAQKKRHAARKRAAKKEESLAAEQV